MTAPTNSDAETTPSRAVVVRDACSRIRCGRYANGRGAEMEIRDVQLPGYPDYDGGLPGVSVHCGKNKYFVVARDEDHFWSHWPWSIFREHFIPENTEGHRTG